MGDPKKVERKINYKYCMVPLCYNSTVKTPEKLFLNVPKDKRLRKRWCTAMKRYDKNISCLSSLSCCEDHFSLEDDLENYWQYRLSCSTTRLRLKRGVVPHKFECQKRTLRIPAPEISYALKLERLKQCQNQEAMSGSVFLPIKQEYDSDKPSSVAIPSTSEQDKSMQEAGCSKTTDDVDENELKSDKQSSDTDSDIDIDWNELADDLNKDPSLNVVVPDSSKNTEDNDKGADPTKKADDVNEGASSSKTIDNTNEGASTSKSVETDNGSLKTNGLLVLSLKCLHDDDDDDNENALSAMDEDGPNSKFIDVNDVPELPVNVKEVPKHPHLEPVAKKPPPPLPLPPSSMVWIPVVNIPGKLPIMPLRTDFEGIYKFRIKFDCSAGPKKAEFAVFSESRNKLYVCKDVPFVVYVSAHNVPPGCSIRAEAVFTRPEHADHVVTRCPTHMQQDYAKGYPAYQHFVQCINEGAIYERNLKNEKLSVLIPYVKPQEGETYSLYAYKLTCFTSCNGGIYRRPFSLVFTLERNNIIQGRQSVQTKVCACPLRDSKIDDHRDQKRKSKDNDVQQVPQQTVNNKSTVADPPPKPASSDQPLERPQATRSEKQKYTISVHDQELFNFLQHMKVLYEMNVQPL